VLKNTLRLFIFIFIFLVPLYGNVDVSTSVDTIGKDNLFDTFASGGAVMWAILICSLVSLAFGIERLLNLRFNEVFPKHFKDSYSETLSQIQKADSNQRDVLIKKLMTDGKSESEILFRRFLKRNYSNVRDLEQVLQEYIEVTLYRLQKNIKPIGLVSQICPLLGLFGTVLGMIEAFDVVALQGLGKPGVLAEGMAVALLTTGFGLGVAIPSSLLYHHLMEKATKASLNLYSLLHELILERVDE
jgi:biopolymer transport protein ExbB